MIERKMQKEEHGYEVLQGHGVVEGTLLGGCLDVFQIFIGTEIGQQKKNGKINIIFRNK